MSALSEVPVYWLNFALHTAAISVLAWIALLMTRDPGRRAFVAASGVLSILLVPWISAARMSAQPSIRNEIMVAPVEAPKWEGWTIRIEDRAPVVKVTEDAPMIRQAVEPAEPIDWEKMILMVWALGTAAGFGFVTLRQIKLAKWRKSLRPLSDDERSVLGSAVKVDFKNVRSSDEPVNPCVVGLFRPCMVIPGHLFESPQRDRMKWAAKHEAEHLRAGDSRWAVLLSFAKAIVWWNPVVHRLCASWAEDREKVCDARAIGDVAERKNYGGFLLELAEANQVRGAIAMAANSPASRLRRRLESIVQGLVVKKESAGFKAGSVVCFAIIGLLVSFAGVKKSGAQETSVAEKETSKPSVVVEPRIAPPDAPPVPLEVGQKVSPFRVKMTASLVATSERIPEAGSILKDKEVHQLMTRIALKEGSGLVTIPSVIARSGQPAKVEIIRANPNEPVKVENFPGHSFVGVSSHMTMVVGEAGIETTIDSKLGYAPGSLLRFGDPGNWPDAPGKDFDWTTLKKATAKASKVVKSGETMVVAFEGAEVGRHLTGFFTPTLIDVTGTQVYDGSSISKGTVWINGSVKVRGAILALPDDGKLPSYWFNSVHHNNARALWPTRHWEAIGREAENEGKAAWKEFDEVVISSKTAIKPWNSYPMEIGVKTTDSTYLELRMKLPGEGGEEIRTGATLGSILGVVLKPDEQGRQRWLLLALDAAQ